jgi:uncharacterized membrane protein YfcA
MGTGGEWAALALSALIGLSLGLVGGGGSTITVPVLVYVAGVPVREAVGLSLAIVGMTAAMGGLLKARQGAVDGRAALLFALTGMIGAPVGARLTYRVAPPVLLILFALLMLYVGARMLGARSEAEPAGKSELRLGRCGVAGLGVGMLTGFLGVGGGFLIVPALLRFARLRMHRAVGTSLLVIAANSAAGFAAHLHEIGGHLGLAAALTTAAVAGVLGGTALGGRMHPGGLKTAFGGLTLAVAIYLIAMKIGPLLGLVAHRG